MTSDLEIMVKKGGKRITIDIKKGSGKLEVEILNKEGKVVQTMQHKLSKQEVEMISKNQFIPALFGEIKPDIKRKTRKNRK